ncbi:MAG: polysaccharide biosynthesis protein [Azoarcus sp.]|jgi:FlaA1/EpsC-like NDP-sugar epimerase|nr:polysaccharide biosynthesis protein [Azoarcus sp.]
MSIRTSLVFLFDLFAVVVAWIGGLLVRFNFEWPDDYGHRPFTSLIVLLALHALACRWAGLYRGMWRFASLPDLKRVLKASTASTAGLVALLIADRITAAPTLPRSMLVLYPLFLLFIMGSGRALGRMWKEQRLYGDLIATGKPVVIVGAGSGGAMLVQALEHSPEWRVVALVDDDQRKWGLDLSGHRVTGGIDSLAHTLIHHKAAHVILAMPSAARATIQRATDIAVSAGARVFTVPALEDLMEGKVTIDAMRPVDIEDLLGREPVKIDTEHIHALLSGKTILITGAGGSIGSELCHQLAHFNPVRLVLLETSEFALYSIVERLALQHPGLPLTPLTGDIKDGERLEEVFAAWRPQLVFHAAAYKHVPLMEIGNAWQAVRNNAFGTLQLARAACRHQVERFVMISTDKAVNPTNVMGASKRLAEMICQAFNARADAGTTQFEIVRFGNVLGSTGSVIPRFQAQIARGGPVTVTHPDITRYFMSIPEAAQLVLQAAAIGQGGEIFVLDMGKPVKIVDLARDMIRLSGYTENQIPITFTGLRCGEKLFEELLAANEETRETPHPKLRIARSNPVTDDLLSALQGWLEQPGCVDDETVRQTLARWVSQYVPATLTTEAEIS